MLYLSANERNLLFSLIFRLGICYVRALGYVLTCLVPRPQYLRAADAFRITWSEPFVSDTYTSPKCIALEGLGRRRTGTRQ